MTENDPIHKPEDRAEPTVEVLIRSAELFGKRREIVIEHDGERYRLRITRRGKLILQK